MRILVLGAGGREHALAWRLRDGAEVIWAPGNPGAAAHGIATVPCDMSVDSMLDVARRTQPDLVVIGPENPLIAGAADALRDAGFDVLGPGAAGAKLEASKGWSKHVMESAGVPTAASLVTSDPFAALAFARSRAEFGLRVVVKASGAAMGKGVIVTNDLNEAADAIDMVMVDREFGEAGETVVIEDRLEGFEFSLLTLVNETGYRSLPVAQDYKRALDGDRGPNTGGMGTYSPVAAVTPKIVERTEELVVAPLLDELARQGITYRGVLFSGLMMQRESIRCLEYNVRFGDPETQSVMRRCDASLAPALLATARGAAIPELGVSADAAVTVVLAAAGYPGDVDRGFPIDLPPDFHDRVVVFHAGTAQRDGQLVAAGGRVLNVTATGSDVASARGIAYTAIEQMQIPGLVWRTDIGQ